MPKKCIHIRMESDERQKIMNQVEKKADKELINISDYIIRLMAKDIGYVRPKK
jgi:phosphoribosylformylglycinamidine (FGAM) synthase PurS component